MDKLLPKNKIYLTLEGIDQFPEVEITEDHMYFRKKHYPGVNDGMNEFLKLRPFCYACGKPCPQKDSQFYVCIVSKKSYNHFYCIHCHKDARLIACLMDDNPFCCIYMENKDEDQQLIYSVSSMMKYDCKWPECGMIFNGDNLISHEFSCDFQPSRECPVEGCFWNGKIYQFQEHFQRHKEAELVLGNLVNINHSGKHYYLFVMDKFILVTDKIRELGDAFKHSISFTVCKETLDYARPVGVYLKKIMDHDVVLSNEKDISLFVYFEKIKVDNFEPVKKKHHRHF